MTLSGDKGTVLVVGAVAYDPKVVTIWEGFKEWFARHGLPLDYVLYSNYERQVDALLAGAVDVAWNSPLAWVQARRLAAAQGREVAAIAMRDTDRDLTSVVVVPRDGPTSAAGLRGATVAVGASDSPQATLLPLEHLRGAGLVAERDLTVRPFEILVGKHGDHVGGEEAAARALAAGEVDAACLVEANYGRFRAEGLLSDEAFRVLTRTEPFDHCNFTAVVGAAPAALLARFEELLFEMSGDDPELRPLFELEGLERWLPGRTDCYAALETAVSQRFRADPAGAPP
jgi:phosphonate transport system substrate-binding protein